MELRIFPEKALFKFAYKLNTHYFDAKHLIKINYIYFGESWSLDLLFKVVAS